MYLYSLGSGKRKEFFSVEYLLGHFYYKICQLKTCIFYKPAIIHPPKLFQHERFHLWTKIKFGESRVSSTNKHHGDSEQTTKPISLSSFQNKATSLKVTKSFHQHNQNYTRTNTDPKIQKRMKITMNVPQFALWKSHSTKHLQNLITNFYLAKDNYLALDLTTINSFQDK